MERIIIIDGNSLMYRAFFALPNMTSNSGKPTGAVFGFMSMLLKLLAYKPTHMAVAFDMHKPTFRHLKYDGYKAGRAETPPELREQFDMIKELLRAMKITVCECEGFEADDILGTLAAKAEAANMESLLVTGDKDALQLINKHTHVIFTRKGASDITEYDEALLHEKYGLSPKQMIDLKGLMGDSSDNLPGVKGVGEKTALKLLEKYGSLEEALTRGSIEEKGALQKKLTESQDSARLSYFLGTIKTDAPISVSPEDCTFCAEDMACAVPLLSDLQLRSIIQKLPRSADIQVAETSALPEIKTTVISNIEELKTLAANCADKENFAFHADKTLTFAFEENEQYELVTGGTLIDMGIDIYEAYAVLKPFFESKSIKKYVFDAKKLMHTLDESDITLNGLHFDAMIADYLLNAVNPSKTLDELCANRHAGAPCAASLLRLCGAMYDELEQKSMRKLYEEVELPLIEVLYDMEKTGFCVDSEILRELGEKFNKEKQRLEREIYDAAGTEFNIQSPKQLSDILFSKLQLPPPKQKTKLGYSTSADVLENYEADYPIVKLILDYRFYAKLIGTFIEGMLNQVDKRTGRIHTTFNQNVTATGRISSTEPNLQTIPVRTDAGREIRRAFVAAPGNILADADYSQIELRVLAHMSGDEAMTAAFLSGDDIHARTASEVFDTPLNEVQPYQRSAAKAVNFGIVYGISEFGLAKQLGVSRKLAGDYIKRYLRRYIGIDAFMHKCVSDAERDGYAVTLLGRRRELFELKSSNYNTRAFGKRIAMNMPVQGTAADIIKIAMVNVYRELKAHGLKAKLVLQIHDELIVDTPQEEAQQVSRILQDCMEKAYALSVPLTAEVKTDRSWYGAK